MDSYSLNEQEAKAYEAIVQSLKGFDPSAQYKILRKLAHDANRELVRPGAVRVAAARASAGARRAGNTKSTVSSTNPKGRKKDPAYEAAKKKFFEQPEAKLLVEERDRLKELVKSEAREMTPEEKLSVSKNSLAIRKGIDSFRNKPFVPLVEKSSVDSTAAFPSSE